jgi:hypothetical protein
MYFFVEQRALKKFVFLWTTLAGSVIWGNRMATNRKSSNLVKITDPVKPSDARQDPPASGSASKHPTRIPLPVKPVPDGADKARR